MIGNMESQVMHVREADLTRNLRTILQHVQTGAEIIMERDEQPLAVLRAAAPVRRKVSECIALAKAHEQETGQAPALDSDFAADVEKIIRDRKPWNPASWD